MAITKRGNAENNGGLGGVLGGMMGGDMPEVGVAELEDKTGLTGWAKNERDNAQKRKAATLDQTAVNKSLGKQTQDVDNMGKDVNRLRTEGISGMQESAGLARNLATKGDEGAAALFQRGSDDAIKQARSLAASTSGGPGAQIAAARAGISKAGDMKRGIAQDAALEQARARREGMSMFGQQQGQIAGMMGQVGQLQGGMADRSLARGALESDLAKTNLSSEMQNRAQNDAYSLGTANLQNTRDIQQGQMEQAAALKQAEIEAASRLQATNMGGSAAGGAMSAVGAMFSDERTKKFYGLPPGTSNEEALDYFGGQAGYETARDKAQETQGTKESFSKVLDSAGDAPKAKELSPWEKARQKASGKQAEKAGQIEFNPQDKLPAYSGTSGRAPNATPVAPMAPPTPLAKSQHQKPMTDAERDALIRNTPLRSGPRNDELEGDTPEMFAARQKAEANLRDISAGKVDDGGKALRDFGGDDKPADGKKSVDVYADRKGTPTKDVDTFVVHGGYKVDPDDPRVVKTRGMSGKDRDAALRWIAIEDANKRKELERAEIAAGLRPPPDTDAKGGGTMSKIGQALRILGSGFSGKSYEEKPSDADKQLADQRAQFAELNARTAEIQKYIDESRRLAQQNAQTRR